MLLYPIFFKDMLFSESLGQGTTGLPSNPAYTAFASPSINPLPKPIKEKRKERKKALLSISHC